MQKQSPLVRQALGKGLDALIPENNSDITITDDKDITGVKIVNIESITPNIYQPRKNFDENSLNELADSIKTKGLLNPILVREEGADRYQIIAGERRWRAAKLAGLKEIPVIVKQVDNAEMSELSLIENIQRDNLNPMEEAEAYNSLLTNFNLTHEEIAERVSKNRSTITNMLRLLKLPFEIKNALRKNQISMGHARALLSIEDENKMLAVYNAIISDGLSVRETEQKAKLMTAEDETDTKSIKKPKSRLTVELRHIQEELMEYLGTKVEIKDKNNKGKIIIEYFSIDDFDRIIEKIKGIDK